MAHTTPLPLSPLTHHLLSPAILHRKLTVAISPLKSIYLFRGPLKNNTVRCMANPRRVKMVAKQIQREISDMLLIDKVLQCAILPEAALGADRYLSSLTTISEVEVSADLQVVKVYVSVFGDERGKELAIAGLKAKAKYVRHELGRRIKLRLTPEVRFIEDESLERGSRVIAILDRLKDEKKTAEVQEEVEDESYEHQDDRDSEADDPDEDIIYDDVLSFSCVARTCFQDFELHYSSNFKAFNLDVASK